MQLMQLIKLPHQRIVNAVREPQQQTHQVYAVQKLLIELMHIQTDTNMVGDHREESMHGLQPAPQGWLLGNLVSGSWLRQEVAVLTGSCCVGGL